MQLEPITRLIGLIVYTVMTLFGLLLIAYNIVPMVIQLFPPDVRDRVYFIVSFFFYAAYAATIAYVFAFFAHMRKR